MEIERVTLIKEAVQRISGTHGNTINAVYEGTRLHVTIILTKTTVSKQQCRRTCWADTDFGGSRRVHLGRCTADGGARQQ